MCKMDDVEERHAAMHSGKTRKPLFLSRRESTIQLEGVGTRHKSSQGNDQVYNGDRETRSRRGTRKVGSITIGGRLLTTQP